VGKSEPDFHPNVKGIEATANVHRILLKYADVIFEVILATSLAQSIPKKIYTSNVFLGAVRLSIRRRRISPAAKNIGSLLSLDKLSTEN